MGSECMADFCSAAATLQGEPEMDAFSCLRTLTPRLALGMKMEEAKTSS